MLGHPDPAKRIGALSLTIDGVPHELAASILNREAAIAVRNGCFCAHPYLHRLLGLTDTTELRRRLVAGEEVDLPGAVRPSFGIFNDEAEVDELLRMIRVIRDRALEGRVRRHPRRRRLQGALTRPAGSGFNRTDTSHRHHPRWRELPHRRLHRRVACLSQWPR